MNASLPDPMLVVLALAALLGLSGCAGLMIGQRRKLALDAGRRLEQEVASRTRELTELALHLQHAREDERARLARDLHDDLGSLLTAAKLDAARIRARLEGAAPDTLERLTHLVSLLDGMVAVKRRVSADLLPPALAHLGLVAALEGLGAEFTHATGVALQATLQPVQLTPRAELTVYRVMQEALTNIAKHAGATRVNLSLACDDQWVEASVVDDGRGFAAGTERAAGYGLVGMRFRVEGDGGSLATISTPGHGATVRARLPSRATC